MPETITKKHKPFAVGIGREEHRRLKILAAELGRSMSDLVNARINELWNQHKHAIHRSNNYEHKGDQ